jgi:hypothetical protein
MNMMIEVDEKDPMVIACKNFVGTVVIGDVLHHLEVSFSAGWNAALKYVEAGRNELTTNKRAVKKVSK